MKQWTATVVLEFNSPVTDDLEFAEGLHDALSEIQFGDYFDDGTFCTDVDLRKVES